MKDPTVDDRHQRHSLQDGLVMNCRMPTRAPDGYHKDTGEPYWRGEFRLLPRWAAVGDVSWVRMFRSEEGVRTDCDFFFREEWPTVFVFCTFSQGLTSAHVTQTFAVLHVRGNEPLTHKC